MRVTIETERLILRQLLPEDYMAAFKWCSDPKVNKYLIYTLYDRPEDVKLWLESRDIDDPDNYDLGFVLKETGEIIGGGGLTYDKDKDVWIIGYNLLYNYWGKGYTTEAMQAIIDYISKTRKINVIEGIFAKENTGSRRIMEKLGMQYVKDTEYEKCDKSERFEAELYRREF
ncbi:MAG: GNAT family N-acetyltransferase [Lachnospiraceae bacterium]|nr:GNAT family N-acetyltransferase [Lachnospiraceae bacterium]